MKTKALILLCLILLPSSERQIMVQSDNSEYSVSQFWQTKLSAELHLSKQQFKLCQGAQTIGENSFWLWSIFNSTTAHDDGFWYNPSQYNNFSSSYSLLLSQAKVRVNENSCNLNNAILKYNDAQNCFVWDKTYDNLISELSTSDQMTIIADTSFIERNAIETFNESFEIKASFDHIVVFISHPFSKTDTLNSELKLYKPWFTPCFLTQTYENNNDSVLSHENWDCAFNSYGYLTGITKALIVVDKGIIVITVSCNAVKTTITTQITSPIMLGVLISDMENYLR